MDYLNDQTSPLVQLVSAFEQIQRVEHYLFATTYAGSADEWDWSRWFSDTQSAVLILCGIETELRRGIAKRIGATLNETLPEVR